ncbi:MAG: TRAP transporter small permease [Deltaproteobacteria bacterium]|nr:TRAP transporter small permease [Deltaproteobacteria bacterium]
MKENNHSSLPFLRQLDRGEDILLCLLLTIMLILACTQIFMRTILSSGLQWADPLLRYLVLWCGLLGALKATGQGKHIALDFSNYLLPKSARFPVALVTDLFCIITTAGLTLASWIFIRNEIEFGGATLLSVPAWAWNIIFPITFGLMCIRYTVHFFLRLSGGFPEATDGRASDQ